MAEDQARPPHRLASADATKTTAAPGVLLDFAGFRVLVQSRSTPLLHDLAKYFDGWVGRISLGVEADFGDQADVVIHAAESAPPRPPADLQDHPPGAGKTRLKERFAVLPHGRGRIVQKVRTGLLFTIDEDKRLVGGPCRENLNQVINFINAQHINHMLDDGQLLLHAAGVCQAGADGAGPGLALAGVSGAGKSSLALRLMERGLWFVSNDRLLVDRRGTGLWLTGVAKHPRINPGTILTIPALHPLVSEGKLAAYRAMPQENLWNLEEKYDADIRALFGADCFCLNAAMRGLVILHWKRGGGRATVERTTLGERRDLLPAIMKEPGAFFQPELYAGLRDHSEGGYLEMLGDCPLLAIGGGVDFELATDACLQMLEPKS